MSVGNARTKTFIGLSVAMSFVISAMIFGLGEAKPELAARASTTTKTSSNSDNFVEKRETADDNPTDNPPRITGISGSPNSPTSSQNVTFTASADDDSRLSSIEIFVDSVSLQPCLISEGNTGSCTKVGGPYTPGSTHRYHVQAKDMSGQITASSTIAFNVQATTQIAEEENMNSLLFRPGTAEVNQETFDIYAQHISSEDHIGTYEPANNWQYVKRLADSSGAEIYIGYEPFLKAHAKNEMDSKWPGTKWVMFDIEGEIYSNPAIAQKTIREAAAKVHSADLKLITNVGSPTNSDEGNIKEFARVSDALIIQAMGKQDSPVKFKEFVIEEVGWARAANPDIPIYIGPSVAIRGSNDHYRDPAYVKELVESVLDKIDGAHYFYGTPHDGTPKDTLPRLKKLMELLHG